MSDHRFKHLNVKVSIVWHACSGSLFEYLEFMKNCVFKNVVANWLLKLPNKS